ncbi:hypothetical protein [Actinomadura gamaensis]|uniref:Uncharacterized protein n=1 Tax=Actinomadura gamaensis TaxID=1763541 RepID=A0ABV9UA69_9ACTN
MAGMRGLGRFKGGLVRRRVVFSGATLIGMIGGFGGTAAGVAEAKTCCDPHLIAMALPGRVPGGSTITGRVVVSCKVDHDTRVVLRSGSKAAVLPGWVTVKRGSAQAVFHGRTTVVASPTRAVLAARLGHTTKSRVLVVEAAGARLSGLALSSARATAGSTGTGTVFLSRPAAAPVTVALAATDPAVHLPHTVRVPAGRRSAHFAFRIGAVPATHNVTVTARLGRTTKTRVLVLEAAGARLSGLALSSARATAGSTGTGTVFLTRPAAAPVTVALAATDPAVHLPRAVRVPAGRRSGHFAFRIGAVPATHNVTVTARLDGTAKEVTLTVSPRSHAALDSVYLDKTRVLGGAPVTGTVRLTGPAAPGGQVVKLFYRGPARMPTTVRVPEGAASATFPINTERVTAEDQVAITASMAGVYRFPFLNVYPPIQVNQILGTWNVTYGSTAQIKIALNYPALTDTVVHLSNEPVNLFPDLPASITIPAGHAHYTVNTRVGRFHGDRSTTVNAWTEGGPTVSQTFYGTC